MFCPQCKAEYRPGFTRCSDCDVDLVDVLPLKPSSEAQMKRVAFSEDRESCVAVCSDLRAAGIPFRVEQHKRQFYWNVDEHYDIWVPTELYDDAKTIAEKGCLDFSDSDEDQKIMELPDAGPSPIQEENRSHILYPDDATVEVWSGRARLKGVAWMVEASLHENGIRTHADLTQDGFQRIFVRPEDEFKAREIVFEIQSGAPPT